MSHCQKTVNELRHWITAYRFELMAFLIIGLGCLLRFLYLFNAPPLQVNLWSDMFVYFRNANELASGKWESYHFFQSVGYPLFMNVVKHFSANPFYHLSLIQCFASCFTLYFIYRITSASFGKPIGLISLFVSSLHVPWILYSNYALPELLFTFLLSATAWFTYLILSSEKNLLYSLLWGLTFIAAFWLKGTHAFWGPLFFLGLLGVRGRKALPSMIVIGMLVAGGLLTHGLLAKEKIGKFQLSSSTGGLNFVEGKCPSKKNEDSVGFSWQSPLYYQLGMNQSKVWDRPFTDSGYFFREGLKCIQKDPLVLVTSFESIPYLFYGNHLWPFNQKSYGKYTRLYDLLFALFAVVGLVAYWSMMKFSRKSLEEFCTWSLPIISLFLCVYIFKAELRYRVPFDLWIIPLSVKGWTLMFNKRRIS